MCRSKFSGKHLNEEKVALGNKQTSAKRLLRARHTNKWKNKLKKKLPKHTEKYIKLFRNIKENQTDNIHKDKGGYSKKKVNIEENYNDKRKKTLKKKILQPK